jgi:prepilin-type N-terminal cleavage/methylation domain-containing protein
MSPPERSDRGFSLIEALIALTIVGLTAVAGLSAFAAQLRAAERTRTALEAQSLAEEQLARLRILPARAYRSLPDSLRHGRFAPPFDRYQWRHAVRSRPEMPDLFAASVEIVWPEGRYALETRLYRPLPRLGQ